jgi:hypothetical protein
MTPHHVYLYYLVEEKKQCNYMDLYRHEENAKGAE